MFDSMSPMDPAVLDALDTALEAAIDEIDALVEVPVGRLGEVLLRLDRVRERSELLAGSALAVFDSFGAHEIDLVKSAPTWLANRTGERRAHVASRLNRHRRLRGMPLTNAAVVAGEITLSYAQVLAGARNPRTDEAFATDEALLVGYARDLSADQLTKVVARWLHHVDVDGPEPTDSARSELHYSETLDGRLTGTFTIAGPEATELKAILDEQVSKLLHNDKQIRAVDPTDPLVDQTPSQRRARALVELLQRGAAAPENTSRRQPLFAIHTTIETLRGGAPIDEWMLELDAAWQSALPIEVAQLYACDGHISRVVLSAAGEPLDVGREKRTANRAQRRALAARDKGCGVPGCHTHAAWTEAHHLLEWIEGGKTNLANLVLLCRHHHTRIHQGLLAVAMVDGLPEFSLPDGSILGRDGPYAPAA